MFYSQFILAKKGPLGTIWIAAHLERKLKKNQVADTDIGDSVDSILFPDVPIALRLSSHLLLGVVRIYSRKVNYLFHDCSEALLKVKQAFRSTAVDLPPEESTAPYHSITLPETFDLDDFELPDSALLNGNSDDRHVSSREQITLQDTVDGTAYSTLQFGLDERFGDGDASQIGLDLDEELLLDNNLKLQHASVSFGDVHRGDSASDLTQMDINGAQLGCDEDRNNEASKELSELLCNDRGKQVVSDVQNVNRNDDSHRLAFNIHTPDLNEVFLPNDDIGGPSGAHNIDMDLTAADPPSTEFNKFANFPSTSVPADFQELPVSNLREISPQTGFLEISPQTGLHEISPQTGLKVDKLDKSISQEAECPDTTNDNLVISTSTNAELENGVQAVSSLTSIVGEPKSDSVAPQCSGGIVPSSPEFNKFANFPSTPVPADTQELPVSNLHEISPQTGLKVDKLDKPVSQEAECPDTTKDNLVISTSTNAELDNGVQAVSSPTSIVGEPKSDSVTPQCSGGIVPSSNPVNGVPCIHGDSKDAANHSNLVTDPNHSEVSQVLPSCILVPAEPAPDSLVPQFSGGTVDTPGFAGFESTLRTADTSHTRVVWNETNELPMSIDNGIPYENSARLSNLDHGRIDETKSCQTNNFSTLSSDFHMRSCTSVFNQNNLTAPGNMLLQKTLEFSTKDQPCNLDTPMLDQGLHFSGSSLGLQAFPSHIATDVSLGAYQKSFDIYLGHPNCFSSSEFSEPERMMFAPSGNANLSSDLGKQTIEKGLIESDGSVDRISSLCGQKRRLVDNTPELQNGTSPNMSGILRKTSNNDYIIPKDDDLLASILVGRRTPALGIGPSPPIPKPPLKRPRLTQKAGLPKRRKVLLDDTMVLHADAIRQQLINTEDIRRMRRKAPCTGPEIWRIQKSSLEEEDIFRESIFTGISEELNSLLTRRYDLVQNMHGQANGHHSSGEGIKEFEVSQSSLAVRGNDGREFFLQSAVVTERIYNEIHGTSGGGLIDAEGCKNAASIGVQEQLESPLEVPFDSKSVECGNDGLADAENSSMNKEFQTSHGIAEVNNNTLNAPDIVSCEEFASADCAAINDGREISLQSAVVTERILSEIHGTSGGGLIDAEGCKHAASIGVQEQLESPLEVPFDSKSVECGNDGLADAENNSMNKEFQTSHGIAEVNNNALNAPYRVSGEEFASADCAAINDGTSIQVEDLSNAKAASITVDDMGVDVVNITNLDSFQEGQVGVAKDQSDGGSVSIFNGFMVEVGADFPKDSSIVIEHANSSIPDTGLVRREAVGDGEMQMPASEVTCGERPNLSSSLALPSTEGECVPSAVGENLSMNAEGGLDVESTVELAATRESSDFCSEIDDIDTDFLNVDDDADYDEEINDMPNTEAQSLENSGWSSRTRGVARYLKNVFDQESGRGRKSVAIDHLLAGKSRKEASRMFFETLVLKTRDYIHVEQENSFDCVIVKPRIKLLKTEF